MDLKQIETDPNKESAGQWINWDDASFLIASAMAPAYRKALRKRLNKVPQHLLNSEPERQDPIVAEVMADHLLLDWKNVKEDGKELICNKDNRVRVLKKYHALREWIAGQAMDISNFSAEGEAESVARLKSGGPVGDRVG